MLSSDTPAMALSDSSDLICTCISSGASSTSLIRPSEAIPLEHMTKILVMPSMAFRIKIK